MGTEVLNLKSFGTLQSELEQAKSSLRGVDENIKRLIGRDPSEHPLGPRMPMGAAKRGFQGPTGGADERPGRGGRMPQRGGHAADEPPPPKRRGALSVFKRLADRPGPPLEHQQPPHHKQMISKVIVTPKELPSRQEALAAQSKDEKSNARNRRMFGALLGTLQKFQQEETKLKQREDKRAQLEKKIEEHEIKEKEEIKKERQELFLNRKKKQAEIKMIELKMMRMKEYSGWEERQKPRMSFIQTKAKPHIHYLPRRMNDASKALLEASRLEIEKTIDRKRQEVFDELQHIEERMKKNFELRKTNKENNGSSAKSETPAENKRQHRDDEDREDEDEMKDDDEEEAAASETAVKEKAALAMTEETLETETEKNAELKDEAKDDQGKALSAETESNNATAAAAEKDEDENKNGDKDTVEEKGEPEEENEKNEEGEEETTTSTTENGDVQEANVSVDTGEEMEEGEV